MFIEDDTLLYRMITKYPIRNEYLELKMLYILSYN